MSESRMFFKFYHPEDITIGRGRVIYESSYGAWVLPGGLHIHSKEWAEHAAQVINEITVRQEGKPQRR